MRLGGEYVWLWFALFASSALYIPVYFWAEGHLSVDEECWYRFHISGPSQRVGYPQRRAALGMLLQVIAPRVVNTANRLFNHQLPPCMFPHPPSSLHTTMVVLQPPQDTVGGYIFRRNDVQTIRHDRCAPVPDCQTSSPAFSPSRESRRARHGTYFSRY